MVFHLHFMHMPRAICFKASKLDSPVVTLILAARISIFRNSKIPTKINVSKSYCNCILKAIFYAGYMYIWYSPILESTNFCSRHKILWCGFVLHFPPIALNVGNTQNTVYSKYNFELCRQANKRNLSFFPQVKIVLNQIN